ncbi:MAG: CBS domain-containing protein [Vicinamibacterales bacterium]
MRLTDIMGTAVETIGLEAAAESAWQRMRLGRFHHLVVLDGHSVAGIISDRDLGGTRGARVREGRRVADLMTGNVVTATPTTTVREAANLLRGRSIGCLPVLDRGSLRGIITVTDLLELIGRGVERPTARAQRAIMRGRGPRRKPFKGMRKS